MPYTTRQRLVLAKLLAEADRPLKPQELCAAAQDSLPHLGIATVYRTLKQLIAEDQVRVVDIPGIAPHYESAAQRHHHFFFCVQCERLFSLLGCVRGLAGLVPKGFAVKRHEIVLYGDCAGCHAAA